MPACRRSILRYLLGTAALAALCWTAPALAQDYPNRPVKLVIPFPAGGSSDGYTLVLVDVFHTSTPICTRTMPYDAVTDFTPVSLIGRSPAFLVAGPGFDNLPRPVVERLAAEMEQVLRMPDVRERLQGMALEVAVAGPAEMKSKVEGDVARWHKLAQELDIRPLD